MNLHNDKQTYFGYDILISGIVTIRFDLIPLVSIRLCYIEKSTIDERIACPYRDYTSPGISGPYCLNVASYNTIFW